MRENKINKISLNSFILIILSGVILLYSYYYLGTTNSNVASKLWGRINDISHLNYSFIIYIIFLQII